MDNYKSILFILLAAILLCVLTGCGNSDKNAPVPDDTAGELLSEDATDTPSQGNMEESEAIPENSVLPVEIPDSNWSLNSDLPGAVHPFGLYTDVVHEE